MKIKSKPVSKNVGRNPIAQAYARQALEKAIRDQQIALYMIDQGEACTDMMSGLAGTMQLVLGAVQIDGLTGPDVGKLKGGLNAALGQLMAGKFDKLQTVAIDQGLIAAKSLIYVCKPSSVNESWRGMGLTVA